MNSHLLPGDKVIWYRHANSVAMTKIPAEIYYRPSKDRVAIRFTDKTGTQLVRFVPNEHVEKVKEE